MQVRIRKKKKKEVGRPQEREKKDDFKFISRLLFPDRVLRGKMMSRG